MMMENTYPGHGIRSHFHLELFPGNHRNQLPTYVLPQHHISRLTACKQWLQSYRLYPQSIQGTLQLRLSYLPFVPLRKDYKTLQWPPAEKQYAHPPYLLHEHPMEYLKISSLFEHVSLVPNSYKS